MSNRQPLLVGLTLQEAIDEARSIVQRAIEQHPHIAVVALYSGGDDSTTMLHLCRDLTDFALHINTGIGIEETREFVRQMTSDWQVRLVEKRTDPAWYRTDILRHGFPGPMQHSVMYHNLKRARLREVRRALSQRRGDKLLLLTGERAYESQRRMGYGNTTVRVMDGGIWVNPIHFFTNWHMYEYAKRFDVPQNPVSAYIHKSGECLCGAFAKREELHEIEAWFPAAAAYTHELEREAEAAGHGKRARWAWASTERSADIPAPGPMCSRCHQLPLLEATA